MTLKKKRQKKKRINCKDIIFMGKIYFRRMNYYHIIIFASKLKKVILEASYYHYALNYTLLHFLKKKKTLKVIKKLPFENN
jgi:hypothetical protein